MRIAVTGGSGRVGRGVIEHGVAMGHDFVNIDVEPPPADTAAARVPFVLGDTSDYETLGNALCGCDALIHLAAIAGPGRRPDYKVHNANVVGSFNALRLAVECGIRRVCQASSANAIGLAYSRSSRYDYFPIDEQHPSYTEDPYSLSKWICEQQADSIARRYTEVSIASLRFHWVTTERDVARREYLASPDAGRSHLFGYTLLSAAATACLRSVAADFGGHEVMFIVAPDTASDTPTLELARRFHPHAKIRAELAGHRSFFDSGKADRLIGPTHDLQRADRAIDRRCA
jgi:nucleoside-diphosphate-sugar epimerase